MTIPSTVLDLHPSSQKVIFVFSVIFFVSECKYRNVQTNPECLRVEE
ncbi:11735_t:CDS:2 [Entrophospora sp. SA101]|nr:11735_t:CDS:2 [Entrophospora sp. SA101]